MLLHHGYIAGAEISIAHNRLVPRSTNLGMRL